ncbi:MAG TPA: hypothetical protein VF177_07540 [Anaerolineae bacterium]
MIELPEAVILAGQIKQTLTGKRVRKATANQSPHEFAWYTGDPAEYNNLLTGKTIRGATACAGEVEIQVDEMRLLLGVLQNILWTARIHPRRKMASLTPEEMGQMYGAVKNVLRDMTNQGGRDTERDLFGRPGGYKTILSKNTVGTPCPACGTRIKKEAYLGGSIYFCESCQKLPTLSAIKI